MKSTRSKIPREVFPRQSGKTNYEPDPKPIKKPKKGKK